MKKHYKISLAAVLMLSIASCSKKDDASPNGTNNGKIDNTLHLAFKTPDWERKIDCTHLDMDAIYLNDSTYYVSKTSESTNETFYFSYPKDSSDMAKPSNLKKYGIALTGSNETAFEFSQKLPITPSSDKKLISEAGFDADSYNEVTEIKYVGNKGNHALFQVKCRYSMNMYEALNESNKKLVTGTFHFKVRTTRN